MSLEMKLEELTAAVQALTAVMTGAELPAPGKRAATTKSSSKAEIVEKAPAAETSTPKADVETLVGATADDLKKAFTLLVNTKGKGRAAMELILKDFKAVKFSDLAVADYDAVHARIQKDLA